MIFRFNCLLELHNCAGGSLSGNISLTGPSVRWFVISFCRATRAQAGRAPEGRAESSPGRQPGVKRRVEK